MEQHKLTDTLEYTHKELTFTIRARATRGDQYEMNASMVDGAEIENGKIIKAKPGILYPWVIKRFVTGWNRAEPWSVDALMNMPAEPGEDLILILGSYILNHVGIMPKATDEEKKKA